MKSSYITYMYLFGTKNNIVTDIKDVGIIGIGIVVLIDLLILFICIYLINCIIKRK